MSKAHFSDLSTRSIAARAMNWDGGGAIVNLSSVAGIVGQANTMAYNASKGAVRLMTKSAVMECAGAGLKVRVNSVLPGIIDTPMATRAATAIAERTGLDSESIQKRIIGNHPIGRIGRVVDVAYAIRFLVSDAAAFMTGSELVVDGGWTAT